jgi:hypothetical protein
MWRLLERQQVSDWHRLQQTHADLGRGQTKRHGSDKDSERSSKEAWHECRATPVTPDM